MTTYIDAGWTGSADAVTAALAGYGFQVNTDNSVSAIDPTKAGTIVAVTGYRTLDGMAYVLVRSTATIALPAGITALGPDTTAAISGAFMTDGTAPPTVIPSVVFFNRFTPTELAAAWQAAVANPQIGVGLVNGLALGTIDLTSPTLATWMSGLLTAGAITQTRHDFLLTP